MWTVFSFPTHTAVVVGNAVLWHVWCQSSNRNIFPQSIFKNKFFWILKEKRSQVVLWPAFSASSPPLSLSLSPFLPLSAALWGEPTQTNTWEHCQGKIQETPRETGLEPGRRAATPVEREVTGNTDITALMMIGFFPFGAKHQLRHSRCSLTHSKKKKRKQHKWLSYEQIWLVLSETDSVCVFTHLLCSKQRDPVFNAGKNQWSSSAGPAAWQMSSFCDIKQHTQSHLSLTHTHRNEHS